MGDEKNGKDKVKPLRPFLGTPEAREFWRSVRAASEAVAKWPSWKRGE